MSQQPVALARIRCTGHEVYVGSPNNDTWVKLSVTAFRELVLNGRQTFDRACSQPGSLFHVSDDRDSATIVRIADQIHVGTANVIKYVDLPLPALQAIFSCGLHALEECLAHNGNWVPLYAEAQHTAA